MKGIIALKPQVMNYLALLATTAHKALNTAHSFLVQTALSAMLLNLARKVSAPHVPLGVTVRLKVWNLLLEIVAKGITVELDQQRQHPTPTMSATSETLVQAILEVLRTTFAHQVITAHWDLEHPLLVQMVQKATPPDCGQRLNASHADLVSTVMSGGPLWPPKIAGKDTTAHLEPRCRLYDVGRGTSAQLAPWSQSPAALALTKKNMAKVAVTAAWTGIFANRAPPT